MTGFDIIVLLIVAIAAIGGFTRGIVQEVLSLAAWILALLAIQQFHTPLQAFIEPRVGSPTTSAILAFALLLLIPYAAMKVIANNVGKASRHSVLGPIDRVLGFGFGALKGTVIAVIGFTLLVLGYDTVWGYAGRPDWIANARSYDFVDASSRSLADRVAERRQRLIEGQEADETPAS